MTARSRFVLAGSVLVAMASAGIVWFAVIRDKTKSHERPKTTAELLVGTWERIESDPPVSDDGSSTIEYTADGKWIARTISEAGEEPQLASGTYVLDGDTIRMTLLSATALRGDDRIGDSWERQIESISEQERVTLGPPSSEGKRTRAVYRRVTPK